MIIGSRAVASRTPCGRRCAAGLRPVLDPAARSRGMAAVREREQERLHRQGSQGGWQAREWLARRAGVRGVSRPPWLHSGSPVALPGSWPRRGDSDNPYIPPGEPAHFAQVLRSLGYRVQLHLVPAATITETMRRHFQLSVDASWVADYPDPAAYLPQFFSCGGNGNGFYCSPPLDREMGEASLLELNDPAKAAAPVDNHRPPAHRQRSVGGNSEPLGNRSRLQTPAQL